MTNADKYLKDGVSEYDFLTFVFNEGNISWNGEEDYCYIKKLDLLHLLQQPIKPTLTEDEKVILRNIDKRYITIGRYEYGVLEFKSGDGCYSTSCYPLNDLFQFIQPRRRI